MDGNIHPRTAQADERLRVRATSAKLKLCAAAFVANESDIVESFVRHTLAFVDHLWIQFHNSYDTSRQIVERLIEEGLPVSVEVSASPVFQRERLGDELVHRVAASARYDYVLPLDADEFIVAESRATLEAELASVPEGGVLSLAWLSFVPSGRDDPGDPDPVRRIRHRLRAPHPSVRKVFFHADMLRREDVYLADGNHHLLSRTGHGIVEHEASRVFLAHYPIRSSAQLASKVFLGALARRLSPEFTENQSRHWRSMMGDPGLPADMPIADLSRLAATYLGSPDDKLIEAPLRSPAPRVSRYGHLVRVDAFERLAGFVTTVFADEALRPRGLSPEPMASTDGQSLAPGRQALLKEVEEARRILQHVRREQREEAEEARRTLEQVRHERREEAEEARRALEQVRREQRSFRTRVVAGLAAASTLIATAAVAALVQGL